MRFIKENPALAAGIGLPFLLVIFFSLAAVIPQWLVADPQYDFLFSDTQYHKNSDVEVRFQVVDGAIKIEQRKPDKDNSYNSTHLYRYNTKNNSVQEIALSPKSDDNKDWHEFSVSEIKSLKLDNNSKSLDGYEFAGQYGYYSGGGLFFFGGGGRYRDGLSLVKNGRVVYISQTRGDRLYYSRDAKFLGWVISEGDKK